jgi:hypothetical protein
MQSRSHKRPIKMKVKYSQELHMKRIAEETWFLNKESSSYALYADVLKVY